MATVNPDVVRQLEEAHAALMRRIESEGPPVEAAVAGPAAPEMVAGAAGCATAQHVLVDHYIGGVRRLWGYANGAWHPRTIAQVEEEGIAQVAFAADRVSVCWDDSDQLTFIRCWKQY